MKTQPTKQKRSAVTLIGGLIVLALFVAFLCGLLHVGGKLLNAAKTIEARRSAQITNDTDKATGDLDPVMQALLALPADTLVPAEQVELSDRAFLRWAASVQEWAVVYRETLSEPWRDTGNRLAGAPDDVKALLLDLCRYEAVYTSVGATKDGRVRASGFYDAVRVEDVPVEEEPDK